MYVIKIYCLFMYQYMLCVVLSGMLFSFVDVKCQHNK